MENIIKDSFNDDVLHQALTLYDVSPKDTKSLGGFENFVYEYVKDNKHYILRFTHSSHRTIMQVEAEIEWIEYLYLNQASVSRVVLSINGNHIEQVDSHNGSYFIVSAFEKAKGNFVRYDRIDSDFNYKFGKAVGKLHHLSKTYKPTHKRIEWFDDKSILDFALKYLPASDHVVLDKYKALVEKIKKLPMNTESYGLIHTDLHFGNIYYDGNDFTFFDFDDSAYSYYIADIAIIIFYQFGLREYTDQQKEELTLQFLKSFCKGYLEENDLEFAWFDHINDFLKLRELILYIVIYAAGNEVINSQWAQNYFKLHKERIFNDIPFFDYKKAVGYY
jgi:Ser/Thr protein kinase RdoA (MazF antagonist)